MCVCVSKNVGPYRCRMFSVTRSPLLGKNYTKWAEHPVRRCAGVNLRSNRGGWCTRGGRDDDNGPMCFTLALSILHGLLLNTKRQRWDAQSRPEWTAATQTRSVCLSQVQGHPQCVGSCSKPGSAPQGVWEWKCILWITLDLLSCAQVHVGWTFSARGRLTFT